MLSCLKDSDVECPTAQIICRRTAALKESADYGESSAHKKSTSNEDHIIHRDPDPKSITQLQYAEQIRVLQLIIQSQALRLEGKDRSITTKEQAITAGLQEIQKLKHKLENLDRDRTETTNEKEKQLKMSAQVIADLERRINELEQPQSDCPEASSSEESIRLTWIEGPKAPCEMRSSFNTVVDNDNNEVYLRAGYHMYSYTVDSHTWLQLPECVSVKCPSIIVNNLLTVIGGEYVGSITNKPLSLTGEDNERRWAREFPSMPTKWCGSSALSTTTSLIVAGGVGTEKTLLATVEVMNIETRQWYAAADLPKPVHMSSIVQVGEDDMYILGGYDISWYGRKSVYTCSISTLLNSCYSRSIGARLSRAFSQPNQASVWNGSASLPVLFSACISVHGRLLAVGGQDAYHKVTAAIHMYNPSTKYWEVVSQMDTPRHDCYATVLPDNRLMVVGGQTEQGAIDTVEIATLIV